MSDEDYIHAARDFTQIMNLRFCGECESPFFALNSELPAREQYFAYGAYQSSSVSRTILLPGGFVHRLYPATADHVF